MIIVADKSGQLANRLFQFGHLIAFAQAHGLMVFNPAFEEYASYFQSTERDLFCRFPVRSSAIPATARRRQRLFRFVSSWPGRIARRWFYRTAFTAISITWKERCDLSDPRIRELALGKNLVLCGWGYRDYANFEAYAAGIRNYFQPTDPIRQNVMRLIEDCRRDCDFLIGVHIRRGDYREYRGGRYCYEDSAYRAVMETLGRLLPEKTLTFLICSNEPVNKEVFDGCPYRLGTNHLVEDLYGLAACDYLIGPPSTFSQWASFYGQVPLYQMRAHTALQSLDQFSVADGHCDFPEEYADRTELVAQ